jgi:hypothetical protein
MLLLPPFHGSLQVAAEREAEVQGRLAAAERKVQVAAHLTQSVGELSSSIDSLEEQLRQGKAQQAELAQERDAARSEAAGLAAQAKAAGAAQEREAALSSRLEDMEAAVEALTTQRASLEGELKAAHK